MVVPAHLGYIALAGLVGAESAGVPVPGETSLIAAAALAANGHLSIVAVIATAAIAAIVGDNVGYLIGRRGGRWILERPGPFYARRVRTLARGEQMFARYGAQAVFVGRWLPVLRFTAAWLAGTNRMPWKRFVVWNGLGGIAWAASIGTLAYLLGGIGPAAGWGVGLIVVVLGGVSALAHLTLRRLRRQPQTGSDVHQGETSTHTRTSQP